MDDAWAETAEERRHQLPQGLGLEGEWEAAERAAVEVRNEKRLGRREEGWEGRRVRVISALTHVSSPQPNRDLTLGARWAWRERGHKRLE